jgi:hypothetical protein
LSVTYFKKVYRAFQEAEEQIFPLVQSYLIANRIVQVRFAGPALISSVTPALRHLDTQKTSEPSLTICIWDCASTKIDVPVFPWEKDRGVINNNLLFGEGTINPAIYFKDGSTQGSYELKTGILSILNMADHLAVYCAPDAGVLSFHEKSSPMRSILHWWASQYGFQIIHAGGVGTAEGGVLLAGKSGTGKSCTALSCINSELGLDYAGDDYVLLSTQTGPSMSSIYNSCKLSFSDLHRYPILSNFVHHSDSQLTDKALFFLHDSCPEKIVRECQIRAILLPKLVTTQKSRLANISPAASLRALAPSTIFQLRGVNQEDLSRIARFVREVPSYVLEIGRDSERIPEIILGLLSDPRVKKPNYSKTPSNHVEDRHE